MDNIIVVNGVCKNYTSKSGRVHAIKNFSMKVKEGDFIAIVGPSGCGKTTLLWGLTGLHPFTSGKAFIFGEEVKKPIRKVGMVFQQSNLLPWRTLIQNINFPLEIMKENINKYKERVKDLIKSVGLEGFEDSYPRELSGGMQQMASLVRALSYDPKVLLMDEPFSSLDAYTRYEMDTLLLKIWGNTKKTIVFVTHGIEEAVYLANKVYVMTPRPAVNSATFNIDLPRPRPDGITMDRKFFDIVAEIKRVIVNDVEKQKEEEIDRSQVYI